MRGAINGNTRLAGIPLADLEGSGFQAAVTYELDAEGLKSAFDLAGEKPVAGGIHFYYDLVNRQTARVELSVEEAPADDQAQQLDFRGAHNRGYHARGGQEYCTHRLTTDRYTLDTTVRVRGPASQTFDSVILFSPEGQQFACIEPLSYRHDGQNDKRAFQGTIRLTPRVAILFTAYTPVYSTVVSVTVIFLFISYGIPVVLGYFAWGKRWTRMGPWNMGERKYKFVALLCFLSMCLILFLGVQPPNDKALWITIAFLVVTALVWFGTEKRRFKGPPQGVMIQGLQEQIKAAERAVGETTG